MWSVSEHSRQQLAFVYSLQITKDMRIARHNEVVTLVFNTFKEMYNVTTWQEHQLLSKWADGLIEILGSAILIEVTVSKDIDWQYPQKKLYNQLHAVVEVGWVNQAYSRLSTTHGHITDCKLDSVVYVGVCVVI